MPRFRVVHELQGVDDLDLGGDEVADLGDVLLARVEEDDVRGARPPNDELGGQLPRR